MNIFKSKLILVSLSSCILFLLLFQLMIHIRLVSGLSKAEELSLFKKYNLDLKMLNYYPLTHLEDFYDTQPIWKGIFTVYELRRDDKIANVDANLFSIPVSWVLSYLSSANNNTHFPKPYPRPSPINNK